MKTAQQQRPQRHQTKTGTPAPAGTASPIQPHSGTSTTEPAIGDDPGIPELFLVRNRVPLTPEQEHALKDRQASLGRPVTVSPGPRTELALELREAKRAKARGRVATMLAKKAGRTSQMPASGVDALAVIRHYDPAKNPRAQHNAPGTSAAPKGVTVAAAKKTDPTTRALVDQALSAKQPKTATMEDDMERKQSTKKAKGAARTKVAAKTTKAAKTNGTRPGTKLGIIVGLLKRAQGTTTAEVLKATGWPAVSMPQQARAAGLKLKKEKEPGAPTRYRVA